MVKQDLDGPGICHAGTAEKFMPRISVETLRSSDCLPPFRPGFFEPAPVRIHGFFTFDQSENGRSSMLESCAKDSFS